MSSTPGEDDGAEASREQGSPPLRLGCFKPFCWKRQKQKALASSSTTAAAVPVRGGVQGDDSENPMDVNDLSIATKESGSSSSLKFDGPWFPSTGLMAPTSEMPEDGYWYPSAGSSSRIKFDGPWFPSTGLTAPTGKMPEEECCYPSAGSSSRKKVDGTWFPCTGLPVPTGEMEEEEFLSRDTKPIGATADAWHQGAIRFSGDHFSPNLDYLILEKIPSYYDRCRLRCVSRRWNDATRNPQLHPPLPLVITTNFSLLNCFADGSDAIARPIKMPPLPFGGRQTACVGSFDDWIVCVYPREWNARDSLMLCDKFCYVLNPSRQKVLYLPDPPAFQMHRRLEGLIQVEDGGSAISYRQPSSAFDITLSKAVFTEAPDTSNCKLAAFCDRRGQQCIGLSMTGMLSWCFYSSDFISVGADLEFFEDSLYVFAQQNTDLYVLHFGEQFRYFPAMVHAKRCLIDPIPKFSNSSEHVYNLVQSNKKLLLVVRQFTGTREKMNEVDVYMLDNKAKPWQWVKINSLEGNCLLISTSCNKSFPAHLYEEIEEETIYFLDSTSPEFLPRKDENFSYKMTVYSLRDRTVSFQLLGRNPLAFATKFPMWFCPPK